MLKFLQQSFKETETEGPWPRTSEGVYWCMARMQVYLPDDLYKLVKARGLPASELLQKAVRAELRRQELLAETDRYVADLVTEVGPPDEAERTRAAAVAKAMAAAIISS